MPTSPQPLSREERHQRLLEASEQYMRGEITVEAFEEAERRYMPDYEAAFAALASRTRQPADDRSQRGGPPWLRRIRALANS